MRSIGSALAGAVIFAMSTSAATAANLNVVDGELRGATGILVGGQLYDVIFDPGSCFDLFSGCDDIGDLVFTTEEAAFSAGQALLDQVFLDGTLGDFDTAPDLTRGINRDEGGVPITPFEISEGAPGALAAGLENSSQERFDGRTLRAFVGANNTLENTNGQTWAVWSQSQTAVVPAPAAGLLLLTALGGFAALSRRKSRRG